jgi:hypothetical protein
MARGHRQGVEKPRCVFKNKKVNLNRMKKIFALTLVALVVIPACKENKPSITFGESGTKVLSDTTYFLTEAEIPEADYRGILVEDLTGVKCIACPNAADAAKAIKDNSANNPVVILGLYPTGFRSLTFPFTGYLDPTTDIAQDIGSNIYGFASLPAGGINRVVFDGETSRNIEFASWANRANSYDGEKSIVNMNLSVKETSSSTFELKGEFSFTDDAAAEPFVTIFLLENNIVHPQYYSGGTDNEYSHQHVVRFGYTPYNGNKLLSDNTVTATRGLYVRKGWEIDIPADVNIDEASLAVFINYNDDENREVIQCTEVKLK